MSKPKKTTSKKFRVILRVSIFPSIIVEASSKEEAIRYAEDIGRYDFTESEVDEVEEVQ